MKTTIDFYEFGLWFERHRPHNFSRVGLQGLFDYLEEYEDSTGESIEFDPIALCVEYTEYQDLDEFHQSYDKEEYPDLEEIRDYTEVIELGNKSFIIQDF
jgi:hypothetical protein